MTIFYLNGTPEDKINDTLAYTAVSDVSPVYPVDSVGSKVLDNDFVNPVYSTTNPAYNNQKPTFYPFAANAAGQSIKIAGNTQDAHDNSATVIRVTNDASSVRSGLFNTVAGKWDSTYVPTTNGYGLCENRKETINYQGQEKTHSINTTELTSCDQSTLVLPAITPLPATTLLTGIFNVGDPAFSYSDITSNLTYNGSIYLDTNNSSTAYEIPEIWMSVTSNLTYYVRCNNLGAGTMAMVLANNDNSLMYYTAKTISSSYGYDYFSTAEHGFNEGGWAGPVNSLIPEPLRDRGQLRFDLYSNCDVRPANEFAIDSNNWNPYTFNTDYANGLYNDRVFVKRYSPELVEYLKTNTYKYFYYYNGDFSEFNFDTDTGWRMENNIYAVDSLYTRYIGQELDIIANPTLTSLDLSAVDISDLTMISVPNFTHFENVNNYSWAANKQTKNSDGSLSYVFGSELRIYSCPNFTQQSYNEIIDSIYQRVVIDRPYAPVEIRSGRIYVGNTVDPLNQISIDSTRRSKIDALKLAPYNWQFLLNGAFL